MASTHARDLPDHADIVRAAVQGRAVEIAAGVQRRRAKRVLAITATEVVQIGRSTRLIAIRGQLEDPAVSIRAATIAHSL